ncbi:peroxisomal ATPase PEX6 [Diabrotica undecimpunctata]|uniref:peroxisomal ATPase PEX6 n=1 Tax=Diabrotica undecimpunctata TaxID=50387 RepID=UPI003B63D2AC
MMNKETFKDAKILFSIIKAKYPKYHPFWFILYMYILYTRTLKRQYLYNLRPVSTDFIIKYLKNKSDFKDIHSTVIVNIHNIYTSDKVLKLYCDKTKHTRIVYTVPLTGCEKHELLVSNTFFENLSNINLINSLRLLCCSLDQNKIAQEINISLISCPFDINNSLSDALLERYFKKPKLLRKGDLIEINIKYVAEDIFFLNSKVNNVYSVFYKCNKVIYQEKEVTETLYCVLGETAIKQSVNVQSFIPKRTSKVVPDSKEEFKELCLCPYGLQNYFQEMQLAVKPFLRKLRLSLKPTFLVTGNAGSGKDIIVSSLAAELGMHYYRIDNYELMANVYAQNETKLHNTFFTAKLAAPCVVALHNFENFGKNNDGQFDERIMGNFLDELNFLFENNTFPVLLFCCSNQKEIPPDLKKLFLQTFDICTPSDLERERHLRWICEERNIETDIDFSEVANKTHGFVFEDLRALVYYAERNCGRKLCDSKMFKIDVDDFDKAVDYMQKNYNESIGAPKVPKVLWSDVGGLIDIKEEINKTINLPLKHPEIFKTSGLRRSGILLFGPPGTGKTLIAKAVATECNLCFLSVKGPELLNMYVGQSEQNIREVFERAREASPCIIFFDELDSLAPNRGISGDSGGVMDRVVSQLLSEMDGLNDSATIFIIGATNRPDLIDPALLRPGRFDKLLYVGPCTDDISKTSVLKALTRKFKLDDQVDLAEVVRVCPKNVTGADFYGICSNAWMFSVRRLIKKIESGDLSAEEAASNDVIVNFEDFKQAMVNVKPSISAEDLVYFEKLKMELSSNN